MYDVIIAGAGPAGSSAAKFLAEKGHSCLLVDKAKFPRDKCCGGALTPRAIKKYPYLEPLVETISRMGYIYGPEPGQDFLMDNRVIAHYSRRRIFDAGLLEMAREAGAEIKEEMRVDKVEQFDDRVVVTCNRNQQFTGRFLIGADSVNSVIRKQIGLDKYWRKEDLSLITEAEVEVGEETIEKLYTKDYSAHIHFVFGGILGYGWLFPKKAHINIGIGGFVKDMTGQNLKELFARYVDHCKKIGRCPDVEIGKPRTWVLHMTGPIRKFTAKRTLLAGDSAGFAHPVSGEGILYAIWSAEIAADTISEYLNAGNGSVEKMMAQYHKKCMAEFGNELRELGRYPKRFGKGLKFLMRIARKDEKLVDLLFQLASGNLSFAQVKWKMAGRVLFGVCAGRIF